MKSILMIRTIVSTLSIFSIIGCGGGSNSAPAGTETVIDTPAGTGAAMDAPVSVDNILNKQFEHIQCSNLLGCSSDATFSLTDTTITGTEKNGNEFTFSYTKEPEGDILYLESEGGDKYTKILSISDTVVKVCQDSNTLEEAQACTEANRYWVVPANTAQFIATQNATMGSVLTEKTQITNFADIQNKFLYQISSWESNGISKGAIKIASDGKLSFYYASSLSADLRLASSDANNYYNISFENNLLHISGKDEGEDVDQTNNVSKYSLAGQSISAEDFGAEPIFDEDRLADRYAANKVFSFTSGNMYCTILWHECWVDEAAMNQLIAQSQP